MAQYPLPVSLPENMTFLEVQKFLRYQTFSKE